jgi:hypothetical protein
MPALAGGGVRRMRRRLTIAAVAIATVLLIAAPVAADPPNPVSADRPWQVDRTQRPDFNNDPWSDLAIGVPGENASAGVVKVLYGSDAGLTGTGQVLAQGNPEAGDRFGAALAKGYFNDDDFLDLAVGAPGEDLGTVSAAGAVVVFYGSGSGPTGPGQVIEQANPEVGDFFGTALTAGDFNNDEFHDLAVGAPGEDVGGAGNAGSVSIFSGSPAGLSGATAQHLFQANPENGDGFGSAVDASFYDLAGTWDLAVGAPGEKVGLAGAAGAVSMFYSGSGPTGLAGRGPLLVQDDPEVADFFGSALAGGVFDNAGSFDLAVGAPGEDLSGRSDAGAVNLFPGTDAGVSATGSTVIIQGAGGVGGAVESGDRFGAALAEGFFDNNPMGLAVGAPGEDVGTAVDAGAVNSLHGSSSGLVGNARVLFQGAVGVPGTAEPGDRFGSALADGVVFFNSFNVDALGDLAVGVPGEDVGAATDAGAVNILNGSATGLVGDGLFFQGAGGVGGAAESGDGFGTAVD